MAHHREAPRIAHLASPFFSFEGSTLVLLASAPGSPLADDPDNWADVSGSLTFGGGGAGLADPLISFLGEDLALSPDGLPTGHVQSIFVNDTDGTPLFQASGFGPGAIDIEELIADARFNGSYDASPTIYPEFYATLHAGAPWRVVGNRGPNVFDAVGADDVLLGRGGNDEVTVFAPVARIDGGKGHRDLIDLFPVNGPVTTDLAAGEMIIGGATTILRGIEGVYGSEDRDDMTGDDQANALAGYSGADIIRGGGGNDRISGGTHADRLFGDDGADVIFGGLGRDVLTGGAGTDGFVFAPEYRSSGFAGVVTDLDVTDAIFLAGDFSSDITRHRLRSSGDDTILTYFHHGSDGTEHRDKIKLRDIAPSDVRVFPVDGPEVIGDDPWGAWWNANL